MKFPFEASLEELVQNMDQYVIAVFSSLESDFMTMPRGNGFIEFSAFEKGYEVLKKATKGFTDFSPSLVAEAVAECSLVVIVIRSILGFTLQNGPMLLLKEQELRSARVLSVPWIEISA